MNLAANRKRLKWKIWDPGKIKCLHYISYASPLKKKAIYVREWSAILFFLNCLLYWRSKEFPSWLQADLKCSVIPCSPWVTSTPKSTLYSVQFSSVQLLSHVWLFVTPWIAAHQASLSITNSQSSLRLTSIETVMPSSHLILCHPLLLLPPIPPSIRVFLSESPLRMRWPKFWSFSFSISLSNEHPGLILFRMDWLDFLAVQETLKSLL